MQRNDNSSADNRTYYLAICRYYGHVHNFVMSGSYTPVTSDTEKNPHPYVFKSTIGKFSEGSTSPCCPDSCAMLFGTTPAYMARESKIRYERRAGQPNPYVSQIFYQAYEVTREQFEKFNEKVEEIRDKPNVPPPTEKEYCELSIGNTCRDAGIALLNFAGLTNLDLSKSYLSRMFSKMVVKDRIIDTPVFIIPAPLAAELKLEDPLKFSVLNKLRDSIVRLAKTSYGDDLAGHKLNELRYLFNRIKNAENSDPEFLLHMINTWETNESSWQKMPNTELMNVQRRTSWLSIFNSDRTSTSITLDKIKLDLYQRAMTNKMPSLLLNPLMKSG